MLRPIDTRRVEAIIKSDGVWIVPNMVSVIHGEKMSARPQYVFDSITTLLIYRFNR